MKHVINSKVYDTETATRIGGYFYGNRDSNFNFLEETLYRSLKGQLFLCGDGGAASEYTEQERFNMWSNDEPSFLVTEVEALEWCELRSIKATIIEEHFGVSLEEG